jgi:hypothetical protein
MTDVNVPTESNKQTKLQKKLFMLASCKSLTKGMNPDLGPYQNVRIRNTVTYIQGADDKLGQTPWTHSKQ